jgi:hypothetical protein
VGRKISHGGHGGTKGCFSPFELRGVWLTHRLVLSFSISAVVTWQSVAIAENANRRTLLLDLAYRFLIKSL